MHRGGNGADADEREPVDLRDFQELGLLTVAGLEASTELAGFITFAAEMDDGEAAACALAVHRRGILVSDDRKARRIISQAFPGTQLLTSSEVIKAWAEQAGLEDNALAQCADRRGAARQLPSESPRPAGDLVEHYANPCLISFYLRSLGCEVLCRLWLPGPTAWSSGREGSVGLSRVRPAQEAVPITGA